MVSYAGSFSLNDVEDRSDLVVEGEVGFIYRSVVPGLAPRYFGHHVLFKPGSQKVAKNNKRADVFVNLFPEVGFWILDDCCPELKVGDQIRVALVRDRNAQNALVMMPFPAINSIVDLRAGKCMSLRATPSVCKLQTNGLTIGVTVFPPEIGGSEMFNWNGSIQEAATLWNNVGSRMKVTLLGETSIPGIINVFPRFVDSISPSSPGGAQPLMRSTTCPVNINNSYLYVNRQYTWSQGGTPPEGAYDFRSVIAHEIGHCLGLGHNTTDPTALMWPAFVAREVRNPNNEDRDGLIGLYG